MTDTNPYSAPDADLATKNTGSGNDQIKQALPRFTTWAVVGLSIITMGIYAVYWLYSRTNTLNTLLPEANKVPSWLPTTGLILYILYFVLSFAAGVSEIFGSIFLLVVIAYIVVYIMWIYAFRKGMNTLTGSNKGDLLWIGGILTFFINIYYFQYKINQVHDHG